MLTRKQQLANKSNFEVDGRFYLVRCMACKDAGERGRENWGPAVASGTCAWCGWSETDEKRTVQESDTIQDSSSQVALGITQNAS